MKRRLAIIALVIVQILSGINTPVIHLVMQQMSPYLFGLLRVGIALLVIGPIALIARRHRSVLKRKLTVKDLALVTAGALLIYCMSNLAFYIGVGRTSSINASIIILLGPILFYIASIEILKERFNSRAFMGVGLAFVGAALAVLGPLISAGSQSSASIVGSLFIVLCVLAEVAGTLLLKKALSKVNHLDALALGLLIATGVYSILALPHLSQLALLAQPSILRAVLYGAVAVGCIGYGLTYYALPRSKSSDYSVISYLQPIAAITVAILFFHETFTPILAAGAAAVFAGLYLVEARHLGHTHGTHR